MSRTTRIMKAAQTCNGKAEQLLRGKFLKSVAHLSDPLRLSALRHWDRMIAAKHGVKCNQ